MEENLLEGRVPARESQQLAEKPIVEDAIARANRGLAVLERIPCDSDARLKVVPVVAVERRQAVLLLPSDRKGKRRRPAGVGKKRGKQVVHFIRDAIELVAESIVQREVGKHFESVLCEGPAILLAQT